MTKSEVCRRLSEALEAFLAKYDVIAPVLDGMFVLNYARTGRQYQGPMWEHEVKALTAVLEQARRQSHTEGR